MCVLCVCGERAGERCCDGVVCVWWVGGGREKGKVMKWRGIFWSVSGCVCVCKGEYQYHEKGRMRCALGTVYVLTEVHCSVCVCVT